MKRESILVTGGSGFVGSAVSRCLAKRAGIRVRWGVHTALPPTLRRTDELVEVDLARPETIRAAVIGVDVVLHLAHLVRGHEKDLHAVNTVGAQVLADEARRCGVEVIALSTAAVYGDGPWRGQDIHELVESPTSMVSRTRAAGDRYVIESGGTVIRPHFVLGPGDRWVIPRAAELVQKFGWIGLHARHTQIGVDALAELLIATATEEGLSPGIKLAAAGAARNLEPEIRNYLRSQKVSVDPPAAPTSRIMRSLTHAERGTLEHDLRLLTTDHYLTCSCGAVQ